jgi:hypothetical protein
MYRKLNLKKGDIIQEEHLAHIEQGIADATPMVNVTYAELVALRNEGKLIAGQKYRMTDYETTCTWENTQVAGHPFDLVLTALDNKTLDEKCSAIWSERDTDGYFANSNLPAWDVRYCLDNDKSRFNWAQQEGTSCKFYVDAWEVYYTMGTFIGEFHVDGELWFIWEAMYEGEFDDMYVCSKTKDLSVGDTLYFTEDTETIFQNATGEITNMYEFADGKGVIYRLIDESDNSVPYDFKNIMFSRPLTEGKYDAENGVNTFCYTFCCIDGDTYKIEDQSVKEPLYCYNNKFDVYCSDNVFLTFSGDYCYSNTFGDNCDFNTFGDYCKSNTFGNSCYSNTFGYNCYSNTFGDDCDSNTFGIGYYFNTFGDGCDSNTFGDYCKSNTFGDGCNCNTFGDGCYENTFINSETASSYNAVQNYYISCVSGAEIQVYRSRNYDTYITKDKSGNIVEYTVEDIINK